MRTIFLPRVEKWLVMRSCKKKTLGTITNQKKVCQMAHFPFECPDYKAIKRNLFIFFLFPFISQDSFDRVTLQFICIKNWYFGVRSRFESNLDFWLEETIPRELILCYILFNFFIGKLIFIFWSDNNANYREEDCNACVL